MFKNVQHYISIPNVDEQNSFKSNNQKEIKEIKWLNISDIPRMKNGFITQKFYPELAKKIEELQISSANMKTPKSHRKRKHKGMPNKNIKKTSEVNSSTNVEHLNDSNGNHKHKKKRKTRKKKLTTEVENLDIGDKRKSSGNKTKKAKTASKKTTLSQAATTSINTKELENNSKKKKEPKSRNKNSINGDKNVNDDMNHTIEDIKAKTNRRKKKTKKECINSNQ